MLPRREGPAGFAVGPLRVPLCTHTVVALKSIRGRAGCSSRSASNNTLRGQAFPKGRNRMRLLRRRTVAVLALAVGLASAAQRSMAQALKALPANPLVV